MRTTPHAAPLAGPRQAAKGRWVKSPGGRARPTLGSDHDLGMIATLGSGMRQWNAINESLLRSEAAGDELKGCYETTKKTGKEQRCSVVMKPRRRCGKPGTTVFLSSRANQ